MLFIYFFYIRLLAGCPMLELFIAFWLTDLIIASGFFYMYELLMLLSLWLMQM